MVTTRSRGIKPVPGLDATQETTTPHLKRKNSTSAAPGNKFQKTDLDLDTNAEAEAPFAPAPTPNSASGNISRQQQQSIGNVNGTTALNPVDTMAQQPELTSTTEKLEAIKEPEPETVPLPEVATVLDEPATAVPTTTASTAPITASTDTTTTAAGNGTLTKENAAPPTSVPPAPMAPEQPTVPALAPATAPLSAAASVAAPVAAPAMPVIASSTHTVTEPAITPSTDTTLRQSAADSVFTSSDNTGTTYAHISAIQPLGSDTVNKTVDTAVVGNNVSSTLAGIEAAIAAANEAANIPTETNTAAALPNPPSNSK
ncbi:hypothetical protein BGZ51_002322 [Haplosporangium sp. Z 767]|nr:hypothetical protein BGZ51_002322 [Haplosporangium sp. Z 767]KAF9186202.1 hypothetical protein BGZ50_002584 [Haplosporangium sp. Z 11]